MKHPNQRTVSIVQGSEAKGKSTRKVFFSGVLVLAISTVMVKLIGLLLKVFLFDYLGEEGMAYFNAAYTIYAAFYMLSTAGFPVAVSILISESRARGDARRVGVIFRIALGLFLIIGIIGTTVMIVGADFLAARATMPGAAPAIRAIAPTLFFICISSAVRGYFQGHQIMLPTAISQIIESSGKLSVGLLMAGYAIKKGLPTDAIAAYSISGLTIGVAVSMIFLLIVKIVWRPQTEQLPDLPAVRPRSILRRLVMIAVPVTVSTLVMSLTQLIDTLMIVDRLKDAGFVSGVAERMYGNYTTLVIPLFNLPPALIAPISMALVPLLTMAIKSGNRTKMREVVDSALRLTVLIGLPCAIGLSVFSRPILFVLFPGKTESVDTAAPLLSFLAISVLFVALLNVSNSILQAYGQERKPIYSMLAGSAVKIIVSYLLIGLPAVNLLGAPAGTFLCHLTVTTVNFYFIAKYTGDLRGVGHIFFKPMIASFCGIGSALGIYLLLVYRLGESTLITMIAIVAAVLFYLFFALLIRAVGEEDILMLPGGEKIAAILKRLHLLK